MRFWKIVATEHDYGPTRTAELVTRYINPLMISELRAKDLTASNGVHTTVVEIHHGANASGRAVTSETGYYEIPNMKVGDAVKQVEALLNPPETPAKKASAHLGVLPVGMMG